MDRFAVKKQALRGIKDFAKDGLADELRGLKTPPAPAPAPEGDVDGLVDTLKTQDAENAALVDSIHLPDAPPSTAGQPGYEMVDALNDPEALRQLLGE